VDKPTQRIVDKPTQRIVDKPTQRIVDKNLSHKQSISKPIMAECKQKQLTQQQQTHIFEFGGLLWQL